MMGSGCSTAVERTPSGRGFKTSLGAGLFSISMISVDLNSCPSRKRNTTDFA